MDILIVKPAWANLILSGKQTWEIRGSNTTKRGTIGIAKSGTGMVYGEVELVDSRELVWNDYERHCLGSIWFAAYKHPYIWELKNAKLYDVPKPYNHPRGASIWVKGESDGK